ncbi:hypothetical protein KGF56_001842 [Candida oxycetoniae]|uniref:Maintenance of telomere capping protein 4 n=1 Tax=Candida oxycetoniae TaxID=497107 RepID=A0AAI9SYX8_9ASCO|nr:uncharacterized protein KGF56_001842 [Candida oxycetoniae]KAI3405345.2 hypothetical protein KGF56_001842 [Candida oxycetoniae]
MKHDSALSPLRLYDIKSKKYAKPQARDTLRTSAKQIMPLANKSSSDVNKKEGKGELKTRQLQLQLQQESQSSSASSLTRAGTASSNSVKDSSFSPTIAKQDSLLVTKDNMKKAADLSSLFLDTRNLLQMDCNVLDSTAKDASAHPRNSTSAVVPKISRSTMIRAEKVKTMIAVKYLFIQRIYEWQEANGANNEHPGIEGVYNPLQILRNRKIRAKYNEYPKPLHSKTIPLACNVFSKHNRSDKHHKKDWRMLWAIELNEYVGDPRWRVNHWHELRNPKGELWFPPKGGNESPKTVVKRKKHRFRHRLHDKLFESSDEEARYDEKERDRDKDGRDSNMVGASEGRRRLSNEQSTGSESDVHLVKVGRSRSPHKRRLRSKVKKFYQGDSSSSSNILKQLLTTEDSRHETSKEALNIPSIELNIDDLQIVDEHQRKAQDSAPANNEDHATVPIIRIDPSATNSKEFHVQDVQFNHLRRDTKSEDTSENNLSDNNDKEEEEGGGGDSGTITKDTNSTKVVYQGEKHFLEIATFLDYFHQCCLNRMEYLLTTYPLYLQLLQKKIDGTISGSIYEILEQMSSINDDELPAYEELYLGFLEETKSILHMVNDNYSIRIDTLLSTSDRSISEINASLSLDLRKTGERLDTLESSLLLNRNLKTELIHDATDYKVLYLLLENLIVVLLKLVWIVVNIYKGFAFFVKILWKLVKLSIT